MDALSEGVESFQIVSMLFGLVHTIDECLGWILLI